MPRQARRLSNSGYMHLIMRGIGRQLLFEDTNDYAFYLKKLERFCMETGVRVCGYCLMENHVHLLVHGEQDSIVLFTRKIGVSYSAYFNKKYDRVGHLFQDRYRSEPVESERYLLTVFRYILQNPCKAGVCSSAAEYPWSSFGIYDNPPAFMDLSVIRNILGDKEKYADFILHSSIDQCCEFDCMKHDDEWAKKILKQYLGVTTGTILQNYSKEERNAALKKLRRNGLKVRQIERLTGINRNVIQRVGK